MRFPDLLVQLTVLTDNLRQAQLDLKVAERDIAALKNAMVQVLPESVKFFREYHNPEEVSSGDPTLF